MTTEQEMRLVNAIAAAFGDRRFDTTSIILKANHADEVELVEAIDSAIPNCRYRRGRFRDAVLRRELKRLAKKHFETDRAGWWCVLKTEVGAAA